MSSNTKVFLRKVPVKKKVIPNLFYLRYYFVSTSLEV